MTIARDWSQWSPEISLPLVEEAVERAHGGVASRGMVLSERERAVVAQHEEAGDALAALLLTALARTGCFLDCWSQV